MIGIGFGLGIGFLQVKSLFGIRIDPQAPEDLSKLRIRIYSFSPVVERLHELEDSSQSLPENLDDLDGLPEHFLDTYPDLHLSSHKDSFSLYYSLGWDPSLRYDSVERTWTYDPGDGSAETLINP